MKIAKATSDDYNAIRNLWDRCFFEDSIAWRDWYFENRYNTENVNLLKDNNKLVSMVHMNPYTIMLNDNYIHTAAMAGVATDIDYRRRNYAQRVITHSLHKAYKEGYEYSFLRPFNYDFYKKVWL